jgi:hypothetical protein
LEDSCPDARRPARDCRSDNRRPCLYCRWIVEARIRGSHRPADRFHFALSRRVIQNVWNTFNAILIWLFQKQEKIMSGRLGLA